MDFNVTVLGRIVLWNRRSPDRAFVCVCDASFCKQCTYSAAYFRYMCSYVTDFRTLNHTTTVHTTVCANTRTQGPVTSVVARVTSLPIECSSSRPVIFFAVVTHFKFSLSCCYFVQPGCWREDDDRQSCGLEFFGFLFRD